MHNLVLISLFLFSFMCSNGDNKNNGTDTKKDINTGDTKPADDLRPNQTILPVIEKMEWAFGRNYKPYSPTLNDIQIAEDVLLQCYNKESSGTANPFFGRKLEDYYRQFAGAELEGGEKVIWINCFCKSEIEFFKNWKTDILMVADGGNCFFHVNVNLNRKEYYGLMVNGMP